VAFCSIDSISNVVFSDISIGNKGQVYIIIKQFKVGQIIFSKHQKIQLNWGNIFIYFKKMVVFDGNRCQGKVSEILQKNYGICWNKNLLLTAMLRY